MIRRAAAGALTGLVVALLITVLMPTRYTATAVADLGGSHRVVSVRGASYSPPAQLYGALGPGRTPATLTFHATAPTRALALARLGRIDPGGGELTVARSPDRLRDVLLGLIAGALVALAVSSVAAARWRGSSSW